MYGVPSASVLKSSTWTMFGWPSREPISASRRKRASTTASVAPNSSTFTTTRLPGRRRCFASHTAPMPPWPSSRVIS